MKLDPVPKLLLTRRAFLQLWYSCLKVADLFFCTTVGSWLTVSLWCISVPMCILLPASAQCSKQDIALDLVLAQLAKSKTADHVFILHSPGFQAEMPHGDGEVAHPSSLAVSYIPNTMSPAELQEKSNLPAVAQQMKACSDWGGATCTTCYMWSNHWAHGDEEYGCCALTSLKHEQIFNFFFLCNVGEFWWDPQKHRPDLKVGTC